MQNPLPKVILLCLLCFLTLQSWSQTISGIVTDASTGEPIVGVSVLEKNNKNFTSTGNDGSYTIGTGNTANDTITFTFLGYESKSIPAGKSAVINVQLKVDFKTLNEVVVVAYGESTQRELTGSITKVDAKKLADVPIASVDMILQGQVAGLQVASYSGQPGGEVNIKLRGVGSITAGSSPLFVVDGIPINSGVVGDGFNVTWTSNSLAGINPNDIASISVLKDASATAIYGSRGANGVIIITTKKGKAGKTKFNFDSYFGVNNIAFNGNVRPMNTAEFVGQTIEGMVNAGYGEIKIDNILENIDASSTANTDWLDLVTQTGFQNSYNLSAQGGDERTQFYISTGYFNQEGVTIDSRFKRLSGSLNLEHKISDRFNIQTSLLMSRSEQNTPFQSGFFRAPILSAYILLPMMDAYDSLGNANINEDDLYTLYNPIAIEDLDTNYYNNKKIIGSIGADYEIIKNLKLLTRISLDQNYTDEFLYANPFYGDGIAVGGWAQGSYTDIDNWTWTNILDYSKTFLGTNLEMDLKLGHEAQQSKQKILSAYGESYPPNTLINVLSAAAVPAFISSSKFDYSFESYFSNAQFGYKQKYYLSGTLRRDGSSRFGINNRYGSFYSVGAAWNIDEEAFFQKINFISSMHIKTSYGQNGNSEIGNYAWRAYYSYFGSYNGAPTSNPAAIGNDNLTWEKSNPFNIGVDIGFLKDRINITAEWYHRTTTDLLLNVPVSLSSGFGTQLQNVGAMENKGIEISAEASIIEQRNFKWTLGGNFATNKNEITALYKDQEFITDYLYRVGESYGTFYMPLWAGVDSENGDALWYTDSTKTATTNIIDSVSQAAAGNSLPKFFGSLNTQLSWKGFTLGAQLNYVFGNQIYDIWGFLFASDGAFPLYNQYNTALDSWENPGDESNAPQYVYYNNSGSNTTSSRYLFDGDYIRLRDVTLGYDFNSTVVNKLHLNTLKIYVKGTNMLTWTKEKNLPFDPDVSNGYGDANLPNIKTITGGINIGF